MLKAQVALSVMDLTRSRIIDIIYNAINPTSRLIFPGWKSNKGNYVLTASNA